MKRMKTLYKGLIVLGLGTALIGGTLLYSWDQIKRAFSEQSIKYNVSRAQKKEAAGDLEGAEEHYDRAIAGDPTNPDNYEDRGDVEVRGKKPEDALDDYRKANELELAKPFPPEIQDRWESAKEISPSRLEEIMNDITFINDLSNETTPDLNNGLEDDPENIEFLLQRGIERYKIGDYNGAFSDFDQVVSLDSENPNGYLNRSVARISLFEMLYRHLNPFDKKLILNEVTGVSIRDVQKAIELSPGNPVPYQTLGNFLSFKGRFYSEFYRVLGLSRADGRYAWSDAISNFNKAKELSMDLNECVNPDIACRVSEANNQLGNQVECNVNRDCCISNFYNGLAPYPVHDCLRTITQ